MAKRTEFPSVGISIPDFASAEDRGPDSGLDNSGSDGTFTVDPAAISGSGDGSDSGSDGNSTEQPKRRGRKPGSAARTGKTAKSTLDINGVEAILLSVHGMLAGITKTPEFMVDKQEANALASAIANVSKHYDLSATQKSLDWANLFMAIGMVYGPRVVAINARKSIEKKQRQKAQGENLGGAVVFPFGPQS